MSNNYQFFLDAKNSKHPFQRKPNHKDNYPTSATEESSDHRDYEEPTITQPDDGTSDATNRDTHTLFMKLKDLPSHLPGTRSGHQQNGLPSISPNGNGVEDMLAALQSYEPRNDAIRPLFQSRPKHWRMQKYPNGIYYGETINGRRHGKGILLRSNKGSYEGDWENDLKHGEGLEFASNGSIYEGQYRNGKPDGYGIFLWPNGELYEGDWKSGIKHGRGIWKGIKGEFYEGDWKNDRQEGYGIFVWRNGEKYEGDFLNFVKHGKGKEHFSNGDFYEGQYENGKPQGFGEYFWTNGSSYKGEFINGLRHGRGRWKKGPKKIEAYDGEWMNDKKAGKGVYTWENGDRYKGRFFDNLKEGEGAMHYADGRVYKGIWHQGRQHGDGMIVIPGQVVLKGTFENNKMMDNKDGKKVTQSFHLGPEVLNLDESRQIGGDTVLEESSIEERAPRVLKKTDRAEIYKVNNYQAPRTPSRRRERLVPLRQSVGGTPDLFDVESKYNNPHEKLNYSDLMDKTSTPNHNISKDFGSFVPQNEVLKFVNQGYGQSRDSKSLSPVKGINRKVHQVASSTDDLDHFEPSGLTSEEIAKWKKMKQKLYNKLHNLDDLSNSFVRQKIRAMIGTQNHSSWQQTSTTNKKKY